MVNGIEDSTSVPRPLFPAIANYYKLGGREREREGGLCLSSLYRGNDQNVSCNWRERAGGRNSSETKFLFSEGPTSLEEEGDTGKTDRQRTAHQFEPLRK